MKRFNIRVYGLLIRDKQVLVVDEEEYNMRFTKFPGGGLEWGEGIIDCFERELKEELNIKGYNINHFYTTDFFVASAFHADAQLISVYYTVETKDGFETSATPFDFSKSPPGEKLCFRWLNISDADIEDVTFPVDKHVLSLLKQRYT